MSLSTFLKQSLTPGSPPFLAAGVFTALALLYFFPHRRWIGQFALLFVATVYLLLSSPWVAKALGDRLQPPGLSRESTAPLDVLIVFDGDNRRGRAAESLAVWNRQRPRTLVVLGGAWLGNRLMTLDIPRDRTIQDGAPGTTREQMTWIAQYLAERPGTRAAVVVSRLQAPRVRGLIRATGLQLEVYAAPVDREPPRTGWRLAVPSYEALRVSRDAIYERAAWVYYRSRGWIV